MIGFWRRRSKSLMVHLIFWPIIAVFVVWGFERIGNPAGGAAAIVNHDTITLNEYRNTLQRLTDFYSQLFQGHFDEKQQKQMHIRERALQQLVQSTLITQGARDMGLQVTDNEVKEKILAIPILQKNGHFSRENYDAFLHYYHMTPSQFENDLRKDALLEKTRKLFEQEIKPLKGVDAKEAQLKANQVNLQFLRVKPDDLVKADSISDEKTEAFLKSPDHIKQAQEYYDLHKSDYVSGEQVHARHILVKADRKDEKAVKTAQVKIEQIKKELATKPFAEVAKKYSDDPGSKNRGGDLGWFERGRMVPEFEKAAFDGPVHKLIGPVQSDFGLHLIWVEEKKASKKVSFDNAKVGIARILIAQQEGRDKLNTLATQMKQNPKGVLDTLEKVEGKKAWEETGFFSMAEDSVPKLGPEDEIFASAFNLTKQDPVARRLFETADGFVAIRLKDRKTDSSASAADKVATPAHEEESSGLSVFAAWSSHLMEHARIKTNPQLFTDEGAGGDSAPPF